MQKPRKINISIKSSSLFSILLLVVSEATQNMTVSNLQKSAPKLFLELLQILTQHPSLEKKSTPVRSQTSVSGIRNNKEVCLLENALTHENEDTTCIYRPLPYFILLTAVNRALPYSNPSHYSLATFAFHSILSCFVPFIPLHQPLYLLKNVFAILCISNEMENFGHHSLMTRPPPSALSSN